MARSSALSLSARFSVEPRQRPLEGEVDERTHRAASIGADAASGRTARDGTGARPSSSSDAATPQRKFGLREHVALEIDARRDLRHRHALALQPHHAALGDIEDLLPLRDGARAGERDLLDRFDELLDLAFPLDAKRAVLDFERRRRR